MPGYNTLKKIEIMCRQIAEDAKAQNSAFTRRRMSETHKNNPSLSSGTPGPLKKNEKKVVEGPSVPNGRKKLHSILVNKKNIQLSSLNRLITLK